MTTVHNLEGGGHGSTGLTSQHLREAKVGGMIASLRPARALQQNLVSNNYRSSKYANKINFKKGNFKRLIYTPVCLCEYVMCGCLERPKESAGSLELHLRVVVSHTMSVLETELRSSAISSLAISLVHKKYSSLLHTFCH